MSEAARTILFPGCGEHSPAVPRAIARAAGHTHPADALREPRRS